MLIPLDSHVFWDADFWMFPPLLLLFPEEARMIVDYRFDHLDGAQQTAKIFGYDGAMFPWESCFSGHEVCFDIGAQCWIEHHVSGDVVFAHLQYYFATHDKEWLEERAWPVIEGVAQFWASRVELNGSRYEINNIRCVDEYANHVNNCVFTNAIAQVSLNAATELGNVLGHSVPANWTTISQCVRFLFPLLLGCSTPVVPLMLSAPLQEYVHSI